MNFVYAKYLPVILIGISAYIYFDYKNEKKFFAWVNLNWFYKRSISHRISSLAKLIGLSLLALSLLDLRGDEQKLEGDVSEQKTIVLIDSSLSMLAEDIRPNRFQKAIFIARHFIKNSAGHKVSIILFSDTHKKLVPFTSDRELLDSRVAALNDIGVSGGGTGLRQAIQESLQYFNTDRKNASGNIILITDAEETDSGFTLDVPESVSLAVIGVGTARGTSIPLRDKNGVSRGTKKHQGKEVITKLDEDYIKSLGEEVKFFNYWIASSYSLPTSEILSFFQESNTARKSKDDVIIRPVFAEYLLIPAVILLIFAYILRLRKAYVLTFLSLFAIIGQEPTYAQLPDANSTEEEKPLSEDQKKAMAKIDKYLNVWKERDLSMNEKMDLASKYMILEVEENADKIYRKDLKGKAVDKNSKYDYFNWATIKLKEKKFDQALDILKDLQKHIDESGESESELAQKVRENTLLALKKSNQSSSGKSKNDDQKKQGDQKDSKDQNKSSSEQKDKKDKKSPSEGDKQKEEEKKNKSQQGSGEKEKKKRKKKLPGLLKQLLNDDRKLQKELLDTSTEKKDNNFKRKDW